MSRPPRLDSRAVAARALQRVVDGGESLSRALPEESRVLAEARDRALAAELAYGVLRHLQRLEGMVAPLLRKPLTGKERVIHFLILAGAHQLLHLELPPHAALNETVAAARRLGRPWAVKLINGVLRNLQRRAAELATPLDDDPVTRFSHPRWMVERIRHDWPDRWEAILEANNRRAPMILRVNLRRTDRDPYGRMLEEAGLAWRPAPHTEAGILLERPVPPETLPGFAEGLVSVQDGAAQQAAGLLRLAPGQRVLDACAAPGGKSAHILERQPDLECLVALDEAPERLQRVAETLSRLCIDGGPAAVKLEAADAAETAGWWDGRPFHRILLDAPCTGSGVIRRHPDIKVLRRERDPAALAARQRRLLEALWPLLAPEGILVYATCSVFAEENRDQIAGFLARHEEAEPLPLEAAWGIESGPGRQILPGEQQMDGFFYAGLQRRG